MNRSDWTSAPAPSLDDFAALAEDAFRRLPQAFRRMAGDIAFHIQEFADEAVLDELEIDDAYDLTGLYQGVDLRRRSVFDPNPGTPRVFLYRRPILDEWAAHGDIPLGELIAHVLIHEIGHHFGLSDDDIDSIEASAD